MENQTLMIEKVIIFILYFVFTLYNIFKNFESKDWLFVNFMFILEGTNKLLINHTK